MKNRAKLQKKLAKERRKKNKKNQTGPADPDRPVRLDRFSWTGSPLKTLPLLSRLLLSSFPDSLSSASLFLQPRNRTPASFLALLLFTVLPQPRSLPLSISFSFSPLSLSQKPLSPIVLPSTETRNQPIESPKPALVSPLQKPIQPPAHHPSLGLISTSHVHPFAGLHLSHPRTPS